MATLPPSFWAPSDSVFFGSLEFIATADQKLLCVSIPASPPPSAPAPANGATRPWWLEDPIVTTIAIATLKVFDIVYAMTGGQFETSIIANEFYVQSFSRNDAGIGAALAVLLFILVIPILIYNVRQMRLSEEQR